jgi:hypothetical protein
MAFLYKEDKFFKAKTLPSTELIGPGQYINQTEKRKIKQNFAPFGTFTERMKTTITKSSEPGPGSYYSDENIKKMKNFKDKEKIYKDINKGRKIELNLLRNTITNEFYKTHHPSKSTSKNDKKELKKILSAKKKELIGFNIQSKRFSSKKSTEDNSYENQMINISSNIRDIYKLKKALTVDFEKEKFTHISSIPSKHHSYGYDILENGKLIPKENPNLYKTFTGEKNDMVGPGNYELDVPWNQTGTQWSKFRSNRIIDYTNNNDIIQKKIIDSLSKTSTSGFSNFDYNKIKENNNIVKYNIKEKDLPVFIKGRSDEHLINKNQRNFPGPGYYYEDDKWSSFKSINHPIKKNKKKFNFGSDLPRFDYNIDNINPNKYCDTIYEKRKKRAPSPTYYFKDDMNKIKQLKNKFKISQKNKIYDEDEDKEMYPFNATSNRFKSLEKNEIKLLNFQIPKKQKSFNSKFEKFGQTTPRFNKLTSTNPMDQINENPGPGTYINPYSATGISNTIKFKGIITNLEQARKNNIIISKPSYNILPEDIIRIPPVGIYHPETLKSINYNNIKKSSNKLIPPFNSSLPKNNFIIKNSDDVGPGKYNIDKTIDKKQIFPPFNSSEPRDFNNLQYKNIILGPGTYEMTNNRVTKWKKKEFNVIYLNELDID